MKFINANTGLELSNLTIESLKITPDDMTLINNKSLPERLFNALRDMGYVAVIRHTLHPEPVFHLHTKNNK